MSQPPLSQQIRALEEETGVQLFLRGGRRVELTAAGTEFLGYAHSAIAQVGQGVRAAQRVQRGELGQISVGFITSMSYTYLPWVLREFRSRHPCVELTLIEQNTWDQIQSLQDGRLHAGILRSPFDGADLSSSIALSEPFVAALPDGHRLAGARALPLESLAAEPFIMFPRSIGGYFYTRLMKMFHKAGFSPIVAQEAAQMHVAVGLVSAHIGVALVPASLQLLPVAGVVYKPLLRQKERAEIAIAWRGSEASPAARAFIDVAVDVIGKGVTGIQKGKR